MTQVRRRRRSKPFKGDGGLVDVGGDDAQATQLARSRGQSRTVGVRDLCQASLTRVPSEGRRSRSRVLGAPSNCCGETRTRIRGLPDEPLKTRCEAGANVEHGAQVGRSSTKRPDARAKSHSVKRTKAPPARRFLLELGRV